MIDTAVILAGGKGERMMPLTEFQPKALVPIQGVPVLKLQIDQLIRNNVTKIIVLTGHLGEQVHDYVASLNLGPIVKCVQSEPELAPAERLAQAFKTFLGPYMLLYCDNFIPNDNVIRQQLNTKSGVSLVLQKRGEGNIFINENLSAVYVSKERNSLHPYVELGYIAVNDKQFDNMIVNYKDINLALSDFSKHNQVKFTNLIENYQSLSNFTIYVSQKLHGNIIIIDRDGILNKKMDKRKYLTSFKMLNFIEENLEIFSKLGEKGYSFIVATNQPGIATGDLSETFLDTLHKKMTSYLRLKNINILAFYVCKHHWEDLCVCRKPMPGLLNMCISDFNLNREITVFIGDEDKDIQAASNANIRGLMSPSEELEIYYQELLN
jgi:mannose-1-phosphate guanylyltransferase/phosphomannomutase